MEMAIRDRLVETNRKEIQRIYNNYMNGVKEFKMTREKALKEIQGHLGCPYDHAHSMLKMFEALGLIKFDEVDTLHSSDKGKYIFFPNPDKHKDNVGVLQSDAVETMKKYGFKVDISKLPSIELNRDNFFGDYGLIRLERWPEGLVIWVGGEIVYKSWKP